MAITTKASVQIDAPGATAATAAIKNVGQTVDKTGQDIAKAGQEAKKTAEEVKKTTESVTGLGKEMKVLSKETATEAEVLAMLSKHAAETASSQSKLEAATAKTSKATSEFNKTAKVATKTQAEANTGSRGLASTFLRLSAGVDTAGKSVQAATIGIRRIEGLVAGLRVSLGLYFFLFEAGVAIIQYFTNSTNSSADALERQKKALERTQKAAEDSAKALLGVASAEQLLLIGREHRAEIQAALKRKAEGEAQLVTAKQFEARAEQLARPAAPQARGALPLEEWKERALAGRRRKQAAAEAQVQADLFTEEALRNISEAEAILERYQNLTKEIEEEKEKKIKAPKAPKPEEDIFETFKKTPFAGREPSKLLITEDGQIIGGEDADRYLAALAKAEEQREARQAKRIKTFRKKTLEWTRRGEEEGAGRFGEFGIMGALMPGMEEGTDQLRGFADAMAESIDPIKMLASTGQTALKGFSDSVGAAAAQALIHGESFKDTFNKMAGSVLESISAQSFGMAAYLLALAAVSFLPGLQAIAPGALAGAAAMTGVGIATGLAAKAFGAGGGQGHVGAEARPGAGAGGPTPARGRGLAGGGGGTTTIINVQMKGSLSTRKEIARELEKLKREFPRVNI